MKYFTERGERAPCYFYRTSKGVEVDLIIDFGDHFDAYEIKFSATPTKIMTNALAQFKDEYPVKQAFLLNLRKEKLPFSNGVVALHWSMS